MNPSFSTESESPTASEDVAGSLCGQIFAVPDRWWGFEAIGREDHPGACIQERQATGDCDLLKGTGAENRRQYHRTEMLVKATESNGLLKSTLFSLCPRPFRRHKISNLIPERVMGRLSDDDADRLRAEIVRLFGNQA